MFAAQYQQFLSDSSGFIHLITFYHSQKLQFKLNIQFLGQISPSVISTINFNCYLLVKKLRQDPKIKLPFHPRLDILTFYQMLTCTTIMYISRSNSHQQHQNRNTGSQKLVKQEKKKHSNQSNLVKDHLSYLSALFSGFIPESENLKLHQGST